MIIIGLLLLIVAAIVGLNIVWKNTFQVPDVVLFGQTLGIHSARVFFLAGIIVGAVLMLGIALILGGYAAKGPKHCSVAGNANRISPPEGDAPRGSLPQVSGTRNAPRTPATPAPATTWPAPARPGVRSSPGSPMSPGDRR
jgi:hypothetical protein